MLSGLALRLSNNQLMKPDSKLLDTLESYWIERMFLIKILDWTFGWYTEDGCDIDFDDIIMEIFNLLHDIQKIDVLPW